MLKISDNLLDAMISDNYTEWGKLLSQKKLSPDLLEHLDSIVVSPDILILFRKFLSLNLTNKQIKKFTCSAFNYNQMREILEGLRNGLTIDQVTVYAQPTFFANQMAAVRKCYSLGFTDEQVKFIANPKFSGEKMEILTGLMKNKLTNGFLERLALLSIDSLKIIYDSMDLLPDLQREALELLVTPGFTPEQILYIRNSMPLLPLNKVRMLALPSFSTVQMQVIYGGFAYGLTEQQVSVFANPSFSTCQMKLLANWLVEGSPQDEIEAIANPDFSLEKMKELKKGFELGLTKEQIKCAAKNDDISLLNKDMQKFVKVNQKQNLRDIINRNYS